MFKQWTFRQWKAGTLLIVAFLCLSVARARASGEHMVPEGAARLEVLLQTQQQTQAISTNGRVSALRDYAFDNTADRAAVSGELQRLVSWAVLNWQYGMSDAWNLSVELPVGVLRQTSGLKTASADPELRARVESLESETLSGLGDIGISSHHRLLYSDWNSFVLGYRLAIPPSAQDNKYIGKATFALRRPTPALGIFFQYSHFPTASRGRFNLDAEWWIAARGTVDTPLAESRTIDPADGGQVGLGWRQDLEGTDWGLSLRVESELNTVLDGDNLDDDSIAWIAHLDWGGGNLNQLERTRLPLPYAWRLSLDHPFMGFNIPLGTQISFLWRAYF